MRVAVLNRGTGKRVSLRRWKTKTEKILRLLKQTRSEVCVTLTGNREIRKLNAAFRNKRTPTDVLSFPSGEIPGPGLYHLGDVIISVEQAQKQAKERKRTLEQEMETLLIHGILHLLGYDHERSRKDAKIMQTMERTIHERVKK